MSAIAALHHTDFDDARVVLANYGLHDSEVTPLGSGLINMTMLVVAPEGNRFVLQRLNPVFEATVNSDIDAVTRHVAEKGLETPRMVQTASRSLWVEHTGRIWRLMTWVPGTCLEKITTVNQARAAGRLLAGFHAAVRDLDHKFSNPRLGVHNTINHMRSLREAVARHGAHERYDDIEPLAEAVLLAVEDLPDLPEMSDRIVHGDPKISNMLFNSANGSGVCMVDLDTVAEMPLALEMGDAFRSWCNPTGEDSTSGQFSLELFAGAVQGYADRAAGTLTADEWQCFVGATRTILVELAARFCTDALNESYFGWDRSRYSSASEHNQIRCRGQMTVYESLTANANEAEAIVARAFAAR